MSRMPHTGCNPGKRIMIVTKKGETIIDKFQTRTDRTVFLMSGRKIDKKDIRSFTIYKPKS